MQAFAKLKEEKVGKMLVEVVSSPQIFYSYSYKQWKTKGKLILNSED